MITLGQKHLICHQKTFSTKFRTKVTISCLQVVLGLLQPLDPDWWFLIPKNLGFRAQIKSVASSEPLSRPWPPTSLTPCSRFPSPSTWLMRSVGSFLHLLHVLDLQINLKLVSNDSPNPKTLVWYQNYVSEPKFQFHFMRSFWAFYRPSTLFLAFRSIWGSWKWSPMIPLT